MWCLPPTRRVWNIDDSPQLGACVSPDKTKIVTGLGAVDWRATTRPLSKAHTVPPCSRISPFHWLGPCLADVPRHPGSSTRRHRVPTACVLHFNLAGRSLDTARVVYAEQAEVKASPAAMQFNCTQRSRPASSYYPSILTYPFPQGAHQNTLEVVPIVAISWVHLHPLVLALTRRVAPWFSA